MSESGEIIIRLTRDEAMRLKDDALEKHAEVYLPAEDDPCPLCAVKDKLRIALRPSVGVTDVPQPSDAPRSRAK